MPLVEGIVIAWPGPLPIPTGWSRATELDGRFPKCIPLSTSAPGTQAGVSVHTHADAGHAHTGVVHNHPTGSFVPGHGTFIALAGSPYIQGNFSSGTSSVAGDHLHDGFLTGESTAFSSGSPGWASAPVLPPYQDVVWIVSPGRWKLPSQVVAFYTTNILPAGMNELVGARGRFLRGALPGKGGGTTGGTTGSHAHASLGAHGHGATGAPHTMTGVGLAYRGSPSLPIIFPLQPGGSPAATDTHLHSPGSGGDAGAGDSAGPATGTASGAGTVFPLNTQLVHVQVTQALPMAVPVGLVALYKHPLSTLGAGWRFCDGDNGTPDMRSFYFAQGATPGNILDTGGSEDHSHTAGAGHTHVATGHQHFGLSTSGMISGSNGIAVIAVGATTNTYPHTHDNASTWATGPDGAGPTSSDVQPIADATALLPMHTEMAFVMYVGPSFAVAVTAPTADEVLDNPTPSVSWTLPGGRTQAHYQVTILDANRDAVVYTTGWTAGATGTVAIPTGLLQDGTDYYVVVDVDDTLGNYGESTAVHFHVTFAPSAAPTGLTVVQFGGDTTPPALPGAELNWNAYVPVVGETFEQWNVWRRPHGAGPWTLLATIPTVGTLTYTDYTVSGSQVYDFKVSYTITRWTVYHIESSPDGPVTVTISFGGIWLHVVSDPAIALRYDSNGGTVTPVQDQRIVPVWGRKAPTVHLGGQHWNVFVFNGVYAAFPDVSAWQTLFAMADDAATAGTVLSIRYGNTGEQFFGVIDHSTGTQRTDEPFGWSGALQVNEVFFDGGGV